VRIKILETISILTEENQRLRHQAALGTRQEQTMLSVSCRDLGLSGEAYATLEQRIKMRPLIIQTHYFAYERIRFANEKNIEALSALPNSITYGVLDTYECDDEILKAKRSIGWIFQARDDQIRSVTQASQSCHGEYQSPNTTIATIKSTYAYLIDTQEEIIRHWEQIKQKAYDYYDLSSHIYSEAKDYVDLILKQSTTAVLGCMTYILSITPSSLVQKKGTWFGQIIMAAHFSLAHHCLTESQIVFKIR